MSIFKRINSIFDGTADNSTSKYSEFWDWFQQNEKTFYKVLQAPKDIDGDFLDPILEKLGKVREGVNILAGIEGDTAALIITADGEIGNIPFVEDLVALAPVIPHWQFFSSKQAIDFTGKEVNMDNYGFGFETLSFYAKENPDFPDNIDITIVHKHYNEADHDIMVSGIFVFLDNYLGELKTATVIDNVSIVGGKEADQPLIPIEKLKSYLAWREKEFVEKYEGVYHDVENDDYTSITVLNDDGRPMMLFMNNTAMQWDLHVSHPWILTFTINYDDKDNDGLPEQETQEFMDNIENELMEMLPIVEGYINVGKETRENARLVSFACKDFRQAARASEFLQNKYIDKYVIDWNIKKDKYWLSLEKFRIENWDGDGTGEYDGEY